MCIHVSACYIPCEPTSNIIISYAIITNKKFGLCQGHFLYITLLISSGSYDYLVSVPDHGSVCNLSQVIQRVTKLCVWVSEKKRHISVEIEYLFKIQPRTELRDIRGGWFSINFKVDMTFFSKTPIPLTLLHSVYHIYIEKHLHSWTNKSLWQT